MRRGWREGVEWGERKGGGVTNIEREGKGYTKLRQVSGFSGEEAGGCIVMYP